MTSILAEQMRNLYQRIILEENSDIRQMSCTVIVYFSILYFWFMPHYYIVIPPGLLKSPDGSRNDEAILGKYSETL